MSTTPPLAGEKIIQDVDVIRNALPGLTPDEARQVLSWLRGQGWHVSVVVGEAGAPALQGTRAADAAVSEAAPPPCWQRVRGYPFAEMIECRRS
jgi:hypothetical protein